MYKDNTFIAIIPARSGSKGLVDKNIKIMADKHLIGYTIEAAVKSGVFDKIIVSTDSEEYAAISREYGAECPYLRPKQISKDESSTADVIEYILQKELESGNNYDYFCLLQPTSPLRDEVNIIEAADLLIDKDAKSVISVCEVEHSPALMNCLPESLNMNNFISVQNNKRRQELGKYYRLNGAIYICETQKLLRNKSFFIKENIFAYIMDKKTSVDIDDDIDFLVAKELINLNKI